MTGAVLDKRIRPLVTPDGVPLNLHLASFGERASALLIDLTVMAVVVVGFFIVGGLLLSGIAWDIFLILMFLLFFAVRSFYFVFFEIRWHGMTPGKRIIGLRVIDRKGGVLTPEAVFARNLMREVELWLPIMLFFFRAEIGLETAYLLLNTVWLGIFVLMPMFNKDRLRAGDLVAGTLVIRAPKIQLLSDPVKNPETLFATPAGEATPTFAFTETQLDVYGIYELQVLEKVLRTTGAERDEIFQTVARQIAKKIRWQGQTPDFSPEDFLRDFYAALRKHHEGRLLFGKRKKDKFDNPVIVPDPRENAGPSGENPDGPKIKPYRPRRKRRR